MRFLNWIAAGALAAVVMNDNVAAQNPQARLIDLDGRKVNVLAAGLENRKPGQPIVVLEQGLGGNLNGWNTVFSGIASFAPVVAYDRPGLGQSEFRPGISSPSRVAADLHAILRAVGASPPYVLVGFSWGGVLNHYFASSYPSEIAGMVSIDAAELTLDPREMLAVFADAGGTAEDYAAMLAADSASATKQPPGPRAEESEFARFVASSLESRPRVPQLDIPVAILLAAALPLGDPGYSMSIPFANVWEAHVRRRVARITASALSNRGAIVTIATNATHAIHDDEPDLVVGAIQRVVFPNPVTTIRRVGNSEPSRIIATFESLKRFYPPERITDRTMNEVGYALLRERKVAEAIAVFEYNARVYPDVANVHDSLGDAYQAAARIADARRSYSRAIELAERDGLPDAAYYRENLKKLEGQR